MADRLRGLGLPGVTARTFHAHALSQLRFFWPLQHDGAPLPQLLDSKLPLLGRIARRLPGHYRFTPAKDLADEIEWAKSRRIGPRDYEQAAAAASREPPIPVDLFVRAYGDYERSKARAGRIDFDDLLTETIDLLSTNAEAAATIRARKRWFSVDEFQDTSPLQDRLLALWAGRVARRLRRRRRRPDDLHVRRRVAGLPRDVRRRRTRLARRRADRELPLHAGDPGPREPPPLERRPAEAAERDAARGPGTDDHPPRDGRRGARLARRADPDAVAGGTPPAEIAVLVRTNAQLEPVESALTRAGVAFRVRGVAFFKRQDVRAAIDVVRRSKARRSATGVALRAAVRAAWTSELGFEDDAGERGAEARERAAAMATLAGILDDLVGGVGVARAGRPAGGVRPAGRRRGCGRGRGRRRRGARDVPPGEGPRVGRGLPADARGRVAADPPGLRRRGGARGGAAAALRRDHEGPGPSRPVVGGAARRRTATQPVPRRARRPERDAGCGAAAARGGRCRVRKAAADARARSRTRRTSPRCAPGGPPGRRTDEVPAYVVAHDATLAGDRRSSSDDAGGARPGEGHGPDEARPLRGRDPGLRSGPRRRTTERSRRSAPIGLRPADPAGGLLHRCKAGHTSPHHRFPHTGTDNRIAARQPPPSRLPGPLATAHRLRPRPIRGLASPPHSARPRPLPPRPVHRRLRLRARRPGERRHESCSVRQTAPSGRLSGIHGSRSRLVREPSSARSCWPLSSRR